MYFRLIVLFFTCEALPFWGSGKFHTKPFEPELEPRYTKDHCQVLIGVLRSKLPISIRKKALKSVETNCFGITNPPAPKVIKTRRQKMFHSFHRV